ncbi:hypothetical protein [Nitrosomonas ureae]|nr:hypothetical protein [Nitrosomonas ureae]
MANFKIRIEKLEKLKPSGLQRLSDDELNARISAMCKTELHDWLENNDSLRVRINKLMTLEY